MGTGVLVPTKIGIYTHRHAHTHRTPTSLLRQVNRDVRLRGRAQRGGGGGVRGEAELLRRLLCQGKVVGQEVAVALLQLS